MQEIFIDLIDDFIVAFSQGSGIHASEVIQGMVLQRQAEGDVQKAENAKIVVFTCALDSETTETKVCSDVNYNIQQDYLSVVI